MRLEGVYAVVFTITMRRLQVSDTAHHHSADQICSLRRRSKTSKIMVIASLAMFLLASWDLVLILIQCLNVVNRGTSTENPNLPQNAIQLYIVGINVRFAAYFLQPSPTFLQYVIGDAIVIWRVWIVWNRDWRPVVAPALLTFIGLRE